MLPPRHRLTSPADFRDVVRSGRRAGGRTLVVHLRADEAPQDGTTGPASPSRVGFVVSKAVGNAVVRNRVKRRLRHLVLARLEHLPVGARLVVRALPPSATSAYADLGVDLDRCLTKVGAREARTTAEPVAAS